MFAKNHISDSLFVVVLKRKSNGPRKRKPKGRAHANHRPTMGSAMSSTSTHGTDMLREGDIATTLKGVLLKGAECAVCGAVKSSDGSAIKRCACKLVYYCSTECQRKDWDDHKARCEKARATAHQPVAGEAFPGFPEDVVVTQSDLTLIQLISRGFVR